jgi:hypothetical protein
MIFVIDDVWVACRAYFHCSITVAPVSLSFFFSCFSVLLSIFFFSFFSCFFVFLFLFFSRTVEIRGEIRAARQLRPAARFYFFLPALGNAVLTETHP